MTEATSMTEIIKERRAVRAKRHADAQSLFERLGLGLGHYIDLHKHGEVIVSRLAATADDRLQMLGTDKHVYAILDSVSSTYGWDDLGYLVYWLNWKTLPATLKIATDRFFNHPKERQLFCQYQGKTRQIVMASRTGDIGLSAKSGPGPGYTDRAELDLAQFYAFRSVVEWKLNTGERYAVAVLLGKNPPEIVDEKKFHNWADSNGVAKHLTELPVETMELISFFDLLANESHQMS